MNISRLLRWPVAAAYLLGAAFCIFAGFSARRAMIATTALLVFAAWRFLVRKIPRLRQVCRWLDEHPAVVLLLIFVAAVISRIDYATSLPENGLSQLQGSDARGFWEWATQMSQGSFPNTKSWVTTGVFALSIKMFGDNLVAAVLLNSILQFITAYLLYLFVRRHFGNKAALFSAFIFLLSPSIVFLNFRVQTECPYFLLLAATLLTLSEWIRNRRICAIALLPLEIWLTIWTRGEGLLLFALVPMCLIVDAATANRRVKSGALATAYLACALVVLGLFGVFLNSRYHGTRTPFCSNDSYWPRLYGSNVLSQGRVSGPKTAPPGVKLVNDKTLIYERYRKDHLGDPDKGVLPRREMECPAPLVPYIREEIARRWAALTFWEKVKFVLVKERLPWRHPLVRSGQIPCKIKTKLRNYDILPTISLLACLVGMVVYFRRETKNAATGETMLRLVPLLYVFGIFCMIAIAESNIRYGVIALVMLPVYAFPATARRGT